jgi:hypothetical protein
MALIMNRELTSWSGQFYFFFGSPGLKKKHTRGLAWFFGQFIYTMALIIFLSGWFPSPLQFILSNLLLGAANQLISFVCIPTALKSQFKFDDCIFFRI